MQTKTETVRPVQAPGAPATPGVKDAAADALKEPAQNSPEQPRLEITAAAGRSGSCVTGEWPYRAADCLDRSASVAADATIVKVKRADPAFALKDPGRAPDPGEAKSGQKVVSAPAEPAQKAQKKSAAREDEQRPVESAAADRQNDPAPRSAPRTRRAPDPRAERARVYVRGPDGRYYLAPEYRPDYEPRYRPLPPPPGYYYLR